MKTKSISIESVWNGIGPFIEGRKNERQCLTLFLEYLGTEKFTSSVTHHVSH